MEIKEEKEEFFLDYSIVKEEYTIQDDANSAPDTDAPTVDVEVKLEHDEDEQSVNPPKILNTDILEPFQCHHCLKSFINEEKFKRHVELHFKQEFQCSECPKSFATKARLKDHFRNHSKQRDFHCPHCSKSFLNNTRLRRHLESHRTEKNFKCTKCPSAFVSQQRLTDHVRIIHSHHKPLLCSFCQKVFTTEKNLNRHFKTHTSEEDHECDKCGRLFTDKQSMAQHVLRIHYGKRSQVEQLPNQKALMCPHCDKVLYAMSGYKRHLQTHIPETAKTFKCSLCEKKFLREWNLKAHMLVHTDERPFDCEICHKAFKTKGILKQHKLCHLEKPTDCLYCQSKYNNERGLYLHVKLHHRGLPMRPQNGPVSHRICKVVLLKLKVENEFVG